MYMMLIFSPCMEHSLLSKEFVKSGQVRLCMICSAALCCLHVVIAPKHLRGQTI
uniref:Uncharacterized protein n=1 Tax=Anguilla anguilla TaxID=7936 RepID=A0A0E9WVM8_ANGAN